jgi:hypothetical protein
VNSRYIITREQVIPFRCLSIKLHTTPVPPRAGTAACVASATVTMFRSAKPRFRLHNAGRLGEAAPASGGRGWLFGISKGFFPRKAVGITPAAFLLGGGLTPRTIRSPGRELRSWPENYGVSAITCRAAFASTTRRKNAQIKTVQAGRTAPRPLWSCCASRIDQQRHEQVAAFYNRMANRLSQVIEYWSEHNPGCIRRRGACAVGECLS